MINKSITIEMPASVPAFEPRESSDPGTLAGTAHSVDCTILERRLVMDGDDPTLEYHRTGQTAKVFCLGETADAIEEGAIGIATMTAEGYWELTSVFC